MSASSLRISSLGVPRIGPRRELKTALEAYWAGRSDATALQATAAGLRVANWARQHALGITNIPSNDFSFYDHVLDTSVMVGAVPKPYGWTGSAVPLDTYFAMARGSRGAAHAADCGCNHGATGHGTGGHGVPALEMTKWFDTNYHYMVSESTWCSISGNGLPATPSPGMAGCRATARAASVRRSSSATCRAPGR